MHTSELWHSPALRPRLARLALTPASWLYAIGWQAYLGLYQLGIKQPIQPHPNIICIGNLQAGGLGKTPVTIAVAQLLVSRGHEVVIGCSGYGSPKSEAATLAPDGPLDPHEWGDEPAMIRWLLPDIPLVVGRRRVLAAELVNRQFPNAILLMDDGFQHLPLKKSLNIILDPLDPPNRHCLPAGPYREPRQNRDRADLALPGEFSIQTQPLSFANPDGESTEVQSDYQILTAIGNPRIFQSSVENHLHPFRCRHAELRPDHDPLSTGNLWAKFDSELPILVTAKDWVKLRTRSDHRQYRVLVVRHSVRIEPEKAFGDWLEKRLNGKPT